MKKHLIIFVFALFLTSTAAFSQTAFTELKAGHLFNISIPGYMSKTIGLNSDAAVQYKSSVKDVYGFVIYDTKEDLKMAELNYTSITEFYESFIDDFLKGEDKRTVSEVKYQTKGDINFAESDATYFDKDVNGELYYLVGVVETKTTYYKILAWTTKENKDKFKADFQRILYSLKD